MQWLAEVCIRRPIFAVMIACALLVAGGACFLQLGVDRFPKLDLPVVMVSTPYPGAAPEEVESEVTQIIEDAVATVAGIDELRSISREGMSLVLITFRIDRDMDAGAQDVRDVVSGVRNRLPPDIDPPVIAKRDSESSPIITLAVSGPREPRELYVLAEKNVKNVIESANGVGEALIVGASERAIRVEIEADRLAAFGLSIVEVRDALARQNVETPAGRVDAGNQELGLRTLGRLDSAAEFEELVIATIHGENGGGSPVRLRDLGRVVDGSKEVRTLSRLNGETAVVVQVQRQSGANTVATIEAVKERLTRSRAMLPSDVQVTVLQDQSRYIGAALHEVQWHLVSGSILASIVVLAFMRSWRSTLIAAVAIPTSIIATFAAMRLLGFTLNNVTMLALVLMVGVVIDDAIVVLENIFRSMEEKGMRPMEAAVEGTKEIGLAVLATTLSLVIVFLPVSFLSSVTGRMLYEFGLTATVAIMISMLISFSLTPMMCSRLLRFKHKSDGNSSNVANQEASSRRGFYHWLDAGYAWCLALSMKWRWAVLLISVATIALNWPLYKLVQQDYIPTNVDEGEFEVSVTAPEGATIRTMDRVLASVEKEITAIRGVKLVLTSVGTRGAGGVNGGQIYVRITDIGERSFSWPRLWKETLAGQPLAAWRDNFSQRDVMDRVRARLRTFDDLDIGVRNQTSLRQGAPVDIDFVVMGPELYELAEVGEKLRARFAEIPGIVDTYTTLKLEKPELLASIDRRRAAAMGVDVREIAETLRIAVGGDDRVSRYRDRSLDDAYDVELRLVGVDRDSAADISQLYVRVPPNANAGGSRDGTQFTALMGSGAEGLSTEGLPQGVTRLDNLVTFTTRASAARIDRLDRQRMVGVRANIDGPYALADRIDALQKSTAEFGLPEGFETMISGRGRELEKTFSDMAWMFVLSLLFMYIILAAQFEHLLHPITILVTLPLATPFGLLSLWIGGETLNLYSALGILVLFGVVKKAAILQVDHTNQLRAAGLDRHEAIMQANRDRLRPILMTTIAFVAGMLPLLFGSGPGAEERRSIAVLAVGGQTLSLLLTLLAAPVVYSYLDDLAKLGKKILAKPSSA